MNFFTLKVKKYLLSKSEGCIMYLSPKERQKQTVRKGECYEFIETGY